MLANFIIMITNEGTTYYLSKTGLRKKNGRRFKNAILFDSEKDAYKECYECFSYACNFHDGYQVMMILVKGKNNK